MVAAPKDNAVTTPVDEPTVAIPAAPELHTPLPPVEVSVVLVVLHSVDAPLIVPASGKGFTVKMLVAVAAPQLPVTV